MDNLSLPPVPPPFNSSTSLIDMSADVPQSLRDKLYFLLRIKHQEQNEEKLYSILNSLILEIILQNSKEIDKNLVKYPEMVRTSLRAFICKYFVSDVNQINKNLRTPEYMALYNATCPQFSNYLLKEVCKRNILNINTSSASSSSSMISSLPAPVPVPVPLHASSKLSSKSSSKLSLPVPLPTPSKSSSVPSISYVSSISSISSSALSSSSSAPSAPSASSSSTSSLNDASILADATMSDSKAPLSKRRKIVRVSDDNEYFKLHMLAAVSCKMANSKS